MLFKSMTHYKNYTTLLKNMTPRAEKAENYNTALLVIHRYIQI